MFEQTPLRLKPVWLIRGGPKAGVDQSGRPAPRRSGAGVPVFPRLGSCQFYFFPPESCWGLPALFSLSPRFGRGPGRAPFPAVDHRRGKKPPSERGVVNRPGAPTSANKADGRGPGGRSGSFGPPPTCPPTGLTCVKNKIRLQPPDRIPLPATDLKFPHAPAPLPVPLVIPGRAAYAPRPGEPKKPGPGGTSVAPDHPARNSPRLPPSRRQLVPRGPNPTRSQPSETGGPFFPPSPPQPIKNRWAGE